VWRWNRAFEKCSTESVNFQKDAVLVEDVCVRAVARVCGGRAAAKDGDIKDVSSARGWTEWWVHFHPSVGTLKQPELARAAREG